MRGQQTKTTKRQVLDLIWETIQHAKKERGAANTEFERNRLEGGIAELRYICKAIDREVEDR